MQGGWDGGAPILNNYPGWVSDLITEHDCGVAVEPENPIAFADALEYLSSHPDRCRIMGTNARALAEREFSRTKLAEKFVKFLESHHKPTRSRSD